MTRDPVGVQTVTTPPAPAGMAPADATPTTHLGTASSELGLVTTVYADLPATTAVREASAMHYLEALACCARTPREALPTVVLKGVRLHAITEAEAVGYVLDRADGGEGGWVVTPNLDHLRRYNCDPAFRDLYRGASLVVADGMPLVWASRLQRTPLPERVAGSSLISTLSAGAAERGRSVYLLGGDSGTADAAAAVLRLRHPDIRIAGTSCPPVGFEKDQRQVERLVADLRRADPAIIYVALGSPKQERVIAMLRPHLPRAWWLGIGISFSFLSGRVRRAPGWMQRVGLEWAHRLVQEPRRLAKRYLIEGLPFAASLFGGAAAMGLLRRGPALATAGAAVGGAPQSTRG